MLRIFTVFSLFILGCIWQQSFAACRVDSIYTYTFNDSTLKKLTGKTYKSYDANGYLISELNYYLDESTGIWMNNTQNFYTNDISGKNTTTVMQVWDATGLTWKNDRRFLNNYGTNGLLDDKTSQVWDTMSKTWMNTDKTSHTYNGNQLVLLTLFQIWENNQWVNSSKTDNTYDAGNTVKLYSIRSAWNNSAWDSVTKYTYTYDAGKEISEVVQVWQGSWKNSLRRLNEYFGNGFIKNSAIQNWNSNNWVNSAFETYGYTNSGCQDIIDYYLNWDQNNSEWKYHLQDKYFSEGETGIEEHDLKFMTAYPNPARGELNVPVLHEGPFRLIDMRGTVVMDMYLEEGGNRIDIRGFAPGIYLLVSGKQADKILIQ